jgi:hypothetical protein
MAKEDWAYKYIPHGVSKHFRPLPSDDQKLVEFKEKYGLNQYDFVVIWNNRNIRRKVPGDVVLAFNQFAKDHPDSKVCLFLHTQRVDDNGTDLNEVIKHNGHYGDYKFTDTKFSTEDLNLYYNSGDIILNIASNEGFGLASCEALRAGTPIVVNVTGGLQDQCGFDLEGEPLTAEDYVKIGSLHDRRKWANNELLGHGNWVYPSWPSNLSLQGSPQTPYIFDDRVDFMEVAEKLGYAFRAGRDHLENVGMQGHEWVVNESKMSSEEMGVSFIEAINGCLENWTPRKRFEIYSV